MKKIITVLVFVFAFSGLVKSQGVEITPFIGYQFGGALKFIEGKLKVNNEMNYGLVVDIPIEDVGSLELYWSHMNTTAEWQPYSDYLISYPDTSVNIGAGYIQIGGLKQGDIGTGIVKGFGSFTLGATYMIAQDTDISKNIWSFAMTFGGGLKIFPFQSDVVGFRLQARLMLPMYGAGTGFYCGIGTGGGGCGVGVSSFSVLAQGDFTGGIIIKIGDR